jgi:hypothetical protein
MVIRPLNVCDESYKFSLYKKMDRITVRLHHIIFYPRLGLLLRDITESWRIVPRREGHLNR